MRTLATRSALLTAVLLLLWGGTASAYPFRARIGIGPGFVYRPYYYAPFWGPAYAYPYVVPIGTPRHTDIELHVTPKQAAVYVDGYYAGIANDFRGGSHVLRAEPGGHAITLHLPGYRTVTQEVYVSPHSTTKLMTAMEPLAPGETSAPVPWA